MLILNMGKRFYPSFPIVNNRQFWQTSIIRSKRTNYNLIPQFLSQLPQMRLLRCILLITEHYKKKKTCVNSNKLLLLGNNFCCSPRVKACGFTHLLLRPSNLKFRKCYINCPYFCILKSKEKYVQFCLKSVIWTVKTPLDLNDSSEH